MKPNLLASFALALLSATTAAQSYSIKVSDPKVDNKTDTIKIKLDKPVNLSLEGDTGKMPPGTKAKDKAKLIEAAINGMQKRSDGTPYFTATIDASDPTGATVKVEPNGSDVKMDKPKLLNNSQEKLNSMAEVDGDDCIFTTTFSGLLEGIDGHGDASVMTVGTARGLVSIDLSQEPSLTAAASHAFAALTDLGVDAWMPDSTTIAFFVDPAVDKVAYFGCSDKGVAQTGELDVLE